MEMHQESLNREEAEKRKKQKKSKQTDEERRRADLFKTGWTRETLGLQGMGGDVNAAKKAAREAANLSSRFAGAS